MAGLELRLSAGDKLIVNGAAIQFHTDAQLTFTNHVNFLFGRQIMAPADVTTPARRIYFALQTAHVGTAEERAGALDEAAYFIEAFISETTSTDAKFLLTRALSAAREGKGFEALRCARRVVRHEDAVLG